MKKIMNRKILFCSILCILVISLVACSGNTKDAKKGSVDTTTRNQNTSDDVLLEENDHEVNNEAMNETNNDIENAEIQKSEDENQHFKELYDLVQLWSELFSNHEAYGLIPLYSDGATLNSLVYYDESYGQLEEKLYRDIDPNWTMRKEDCEYQYGDNTATIWYYAKVNEVKTIVIKETLTTDYVNGVLRVIEEKHEIYDEVKSKSDYDNAYTIIEDSNTYFDFYKYLCDEVIVNQKLTEYFEPGTAAEKTLNLSGGLISKVEYFYEDGEGREAVEQGKDDKIRYAEVTYEFSNGELTVIPMYKTYTNVWFPVSLGSLSSYVNAEFMKVTKEDYENAVLASEFLGNYGGTSQRLYLLADFDSVLVYGTDSNYVIVIQHEVARPYNISWYSPLFTEPKISFMDSNEDGEKEIYCSMHVGTGTGVSVDFLYVFDRASSGSYQCYEFDSYDYIKMLQASFFYTYEKDTDQIQYYVNGRPEGEAFTMYDAIYGDDGVVNNEREKLTFEGITLGDFISFDVTKDIIITAELEGIAKEYVIPAFYQGSLQAKVHYYNDGKFYLTDTVLLSSEENEEEKNKHLVMIPNGEGYSYDLDGDGVIETLHYDRYEKENEYYIETLPLLTINNDQYDMEALSELGAHLCNSDYGEWYIVDLDITDSYKEIALYDDGPSGDPVTYFLRYEKGKLSYIGAVGDMPKASSFSVNGDGTVNSMIRLAIYQTWWADTIYSFNEEGKLVEQRPEWYQPYIWRHSGYTEEYIVQDIELYESASLDAKSVSLSAGTEVYLTATDDEHWIQVTTTDWQKAWFYVKGYDSVQLPGQTLPVEEFISYRCLAD